MLQVCCIVSFLTDVSKAVTKHAAHNQQNEGMYSLTFTANINKCIQVEADYPAQSLLPQWQINPLENKKQINSTEAN